MDYEPHPEPSSFFDGVDGAAEYPIVSHCDELLFQWTPRAAAPPQSSEVVVAAVDCLVRHERRPHSAQCPSDGDRTCTVRFLSRESMARVDEQALCAAFERMCELDGLASWYARKPLVFVWAVADRGVLPDWRPQLTMPSCSDMVRAALHEMQADAVVESYARWVAPMLECLTMVRRLYRAAAPWTSIKQCIDAKRSFFVTLRELAFQNLLHERVFLDSVVQEHPPSAQYRGEVVTAIVKDLEQHNVEVADGMLELVSDHMLSRARVGGADERPAFRSFELGPPDRDHGQRIITLKMNRYMMNNVGLIGWPGGYLLAEFALARPELFAGKCCVELGCGMGITACSLLKTEPSAARVVATDYDDEALQLCRFNVNLNCRAETEVLVQHLDWCTASQEEIVQLGAQVVLAADVIYLPDVVNDLVRVLSVMLKAAGVEGEAYLCNSVRNESTYDVFEKALLDHGLEVSLVQDIDSIPVVFQTCRSGEELRLIRVVLASHA